MTLLSNIEQARLRQYDPLGYTIGAYDRDFALRMEDLGYLIYKGGGLDGNRTYELSAAGREVVGLGPEPDPDLGCKGLVKQWKEAARRDDLFDHMVPSDVRQLVAEIEWLQTALERIIKGNHRCPTPQALLTWAQDVARTALSPDTPRGI